MPGNWKYAIATIVALGWAGPSFAAYPERPVHIIVAYAPGGGTDLVARVVAKKLSTTWNQSVIVENRAGGDGSIADDYVAHAAPDGYTLIMATTNHTIPPEGYKQNYDQIKSFTAIGRVGFTPNLLVVHPSVPVNSAGELIAYAKANPNKLNFGADGTGSPVYMAMAVLMRDAGIKLVNVTYQGGGAALIGLLGNEVQVLFSSVGAARPQMEAGKLKVLAISTGVRSPGLPNVPTVAEATGIKSYDQGSYIALLGPAGLPRPVVDKLSTDLVAAAHHTEVRQTLTDKLGFIIDTDTPDQLQTYLINDRANWETILKTIERK